MTSKGETGDAGAACGLRWAFFLDIKQIGHNQFPLFVSRRESHEWPVDLVLMCSAADRWRWYGARKYNHPSYGAFAVARDRDDGRGSRRTNRHELGRKTLSEKAQNRHPLFPDHSPRILENFRPNAPGATSPTRTQKQKTGLHHGNLKGPRQAGQGDPSPRPNRYDDPFATESLRLSRGWGGGRREGETVEGVCKSCWATTGKW